MTEFGLPPSEKRPNREKIWVDVIAAAHMHGISSNAMQVLVAMKQVQSFINPHDVQTRIGTLRNQTGLSRRSVQNATRELRKEGIAIPCHSGKKLMKEPPVGGAGTTLYIIHRIFPKVNDKKINKGDYNDYLKLVLAGALRRFENERPYQWLKWGRFLTFAHGNAVTLEEKPQFLIILKLRPITNTRDRTINPPEPNKFIRKSIGDHLMKLEGLACFYSQHHVEIGLTKEWEYRPWQEG